jgi:type VI secretion system protein ImpG
MDPRLLRYYEEELQFMREMGSEFAAEFPKIAGRVGLETLECADPYVERLLEGFSFLTARIQLKLDAQFPRFTGNLLETVYPHYMAPTPSMAVVQFQPDPGEGALAAGVPVPRGTVLRSRIGKGEQTACEFRTAHEFHLWPIQLVEAEYFSRDVASLELPNIQGVRAGIRLRLQTTAGLTFDKLALDKLPVYLPGHGDLPMHLYEQLLANAVAVVVRPTQKPIEWQQVLDSSHVTSLGFGDDESLLPAVKQSFQGYRLLQEYMAFPNRFMFVNLVGLSPAIRRCASNQIDIIVLLNRNDEVLENRVSSAHFALFCTPAINLFPKRADRIHIDPKLAEFQIIPDRTRSEDFEVHSVTEVVGYGDAQSTEQEFLPFYGITDRGGSKAFYSLRRMPRLLSERQKEQGPRSTYTGSEVFVSLVDPSEAPFRHSLRQLGIRALCTNRDLPMHMPIGQAASDFTLEASLPVKVVRCVNGPSKPRCSPVHAAAELGWRLVSHLSLNYLSLVDEDPKQGAAAIRELLTLYDVVSDPITRKQIAGVRSIASKPVVRRVPRPGPIAYGRGVQITVTFDESAFEGTGAFLMGAVLDHFFRRYVSLNSFTETIAATVDRGEIVRWPVRIGCRQTI